MKKETVNEFKDGLNLDLHPIVTPNSVLTDNLNGTFITYNGNEFCLQNDRGNKYITSLSAGFTPIGIKEFNGILYIISVNGDLTEIGTFPGISNWSTTSGNLDFNYHALQNLSVDLERFIIYSSRDNDELNEQDITIDYAACEEIINRYNGVYNQGYFGSLFTDKGHNYVMFGSEQDCDDCLDELNYLYNIFRKSSIADSEETRFVAELGYDTEHPVTIETQPSYDGSVNLILVDNKNKPRIINSGFSVEPGNKYNIIDRNQTVKTNWYNDLTQTELIRTSNTITNFELESVQSGGQLKGGNYTFYLKFGDADYNQTDVVAESGIVSVFKGNDGVPSTISGTLLDERTDKMVGLKITGLNLSYSKLYIYYTREYSDTQGYRMTESGMLLDPIDLKDDGDGSQIIWITGFEQTQPINIEELNVDYHTIDSARAEAQHSNMLFLGNVKQESTFKLYEELSEFSKGIIVTTRTDSSSTLGYVYSGTYNCPNGSEYYDTKNIYNNVGYWPDEYYRFGIVYILQDGSTTPVFNLTGCKFTNIGQNNTSFSKEDQNEFGVFKTPNISIMGSTANTPLYFEFTLPQSFDYDLRKKLAGYFIVRQKRIPLTICQGLNIGIDSVSHTPTTFNGSAWVTESFISHSRNLRPEIQIYENPLLTYNDIYVNGSTSIEPVEINEYKSAFQPLSENTFTNIGSENPETPLALLNAARNTVGQQEIIICEPDTSYISGLATKPYTVTVTKYRLTINNMSVDTNDTRITVIEDSEQTQWDGMYNGLRVLVTDNWERTALADIVAANQELVAYSTSESNKFIKLNEDLFDTWGIASLDPCVNSSVANQLDGSKFNVRKEYSVTASGNNTLMITNTINSFVGQGDDNFKCAFISPETNVKTIDEYSYSNIAGNTTSVKGKPVSESYFMIPDTKNGKIVYKLDKNRNDTRIAKFEDWFSGSYNDKKPSNLNQLNRNINLVRGKFLPYVGVVAPFDWKNTEPGHDESNHYMGIYSIRNNDVPEAIAIRSKDNSPFYTVSKRCKITTDSNIERSVSVHRGDCYICTVTMRVISNFIDMTAPASTEIVDPYSWSYNVVVRAADASSIGNQIAYDDVNLSDVNTVSLGYWISFKCLSSYNLGLRSIDSFHNDEMALLGSPRSFYPLNGGSTATGNKMEESFLLNDGYSATVGEKRYNLWPDIPYSKSEFANRIMFSNVHITDAFTNGYRTFQGLAYKDYDKQYGAITKLVSLGQNIFIVMEHGLGLVPVNPKALMQTTTGEAIHIYGYGVLPDEITVISQDYGSKYEHSVIRTPIGIYGIDVDAKKIWRFSNKQGFETISDMKIETYLKDNLEPFEVNLGISDVRTHYNANKGDLMFTWYSKTNDVLCSICYNERQNLWVTRYDWVPIVSENINDEFYSLQRTLDNPIYKIWDHSNDVGIDTTNKQVSQWYDSNHGFEFEFVVSDPIGVNKIFDNLQIISNNVQPEEMEITVIGDDYEFKRDVVELNDSRAIRKEVETDNPNIITTTSNIHGEINNVPDNTHKPNGYYHFDKRLNQSAITKWQPFKDIYKFGRRIGNIQYKNASWYAQIEPLLVNDSRLVAKEARIRDKWARVRIRYSGKDLAVITAIRTLINI